jgi:hypothetical protein
MVNINDAQFYHSAKRCRERYNQQINRDQYRWLSNQIANKTEKAVFIKKLSKRKSLWKIIFSDVVFYVAYDEPMKNICSFLPPL